VVCPPASESDRSSIRSAPTRTDGTACAVSQSSGLGKLSAGQRGKFTRSKDGQGGIGGGGIVHGTCRVLAGQQWRARQGSFERLTGRAIGRGLDVVAPFLPGYLSGRVIREAIVVGVAGFEPATPSSRTRCATGLRYTPTWPGGLIASAPMPCKARFGGAVRWSEPRHVGRSRGYACRQGR
jgi:hypothetical protein